jgi:hypothetical protein
VVRVLATFRRLRPTGRWSAALVLVIGLLATLIIGVILYRSDERSAGELMDKRVMATQQAVATESRRYVDALEVVAGGLAAPIELTKDAFLAVTAPLRQLGLNGATGVTFVASAADAEIAGVQSYWRAHGEPALALTSVGTGQEHLFSIFQRPLDGGLPIVGVDFSQVAPATAALLLARRVDQLVVSEPYVLLRDRALPADHRQLSFVLAEPVFAQSTGAFRGWILMAMRGQDFIGSTLRVAAQGLLAVSLHVQHEGRLLEVARLKLATGRPDLHRTVDVVVADRSWQLSVDADSGTLPSGTTLLSIDVVTLGGLLSILTALLVYSKRTGGHRARAAMR